MPGISDFYRGDTLSFDITIKDQNGNPVDITGAKLFFTMKEQPTQSDSEAVVQEVVYDHIDPTEGHTKIIVPSSSTSILVPGKTYYYDFQLVDSNGNVKTLYAGKVRVLQDITQRTN